MSEISELKLKCESAALRTEIWMLKHLSEEGILQSDIPDPVSYYKWPLTLHARNKDQAARDLLQWIMDRSLAENGDLISRRSGFHKDFNSYANLWLVLVTIKLGETQLTDKLLGFLLKHHNQSSGGMKTIPGSVKKITEDPLSTSFLGMAACELGDSELADLVLKYLNSLVRLQPSTHKFWLRTTQEGELITVPAPDEDPKTYVINIGKQDETYYFLGAMCFFLAMYIERFKMNDNANELVYQLSVLLDKAGPIALGTIWAAKVAPGAIALYSVLSDKRFFRFAEPVIHAVLAGQSESGYWLKDNNPWVTVSAEQCYWLSFISSRL